MSVGKESTKEFYASNYSYEEENDEYNEIKKLLDGLTNKKQAKKYKDIYNNLDFNSKERVLEITLTGLNGDYKGKLDKKEANAFLFVNVIDFILCINEYENNKTDGLLILNIKSILNLLFKLYPGTRNAFSEEEIEIIRNLGKEEKQKKEEKIENKK